ncbi:MAG: bifunctional demethylmenaquinone methyltransferase/2-methoxy-6-polyprenyl-1,4-benzoquinol methylase UbiE [Bacteroidia bacterium]|nr:bifunctional demethylmenaquinone methyltransferase/2-methoxy-6-polyprenyl-1,4-benzoquinol methylase UbiE [Bacteroidia bacterium]MDW8134089.1 bifunctional demethylmenaquinone methyltransferase/2-methoxy-6-polyprenyl-1,4-benzoquinol methylase UbiE [Bacteroidia bacterium]
MQNPTGTSHIFQRIAKRYDFMNRLMTFGQDVRWRRKAAQRLAKWAPKKLLDLAAGTGDFALQACYTLSSLTEVYLVDITPEMLDLAYDKRPPHISPKWHMVIADAHLLPFEDNSFDAVTVGYGIRNFTDRRRALQEIHRVLRPKGVCMILETGMPRHPLWKHLFSFYMRTYVRGLGFIVAGDAQAYSYLFESTTTFPHREEFLHLCREVGFAITNYTSFLGGVSILYELHKPTY